MHYLIQEFARLVGVSVRTLHYYDQIDLLKPTSTSPSGYRQYTDDNLDRMQQILFFKEIGFDLQEIKNILDHPNFDRKQALTAHRDLLLMKKQRLDEIIASVDTTLEMMKGDRTVNPVERFKPFDMEAIEKHKAKYAEEVRQKYPADKVAECEQKTSDYNTGDWKQIWEKGNLIYCQLADLIGRGSADQEVQKLVADYRQFITDNFYDCTPEIFRGLGELYVADERFTHNIDQFGSGLSEFLHQAINIYCDKLAKKS